MFSNQLAKSLYFMGEICSQILKGLMYAKTMENGNYRDGSYVNPKRCGLLGQLRMRGGVKVSLWQIMVSGHSNFGTDQTNSVSYES